MCHKIIFRIQNYVFIYLKGFKIKWNGWLDQPGILYGFYIIFVANAKTGDSLTILRSSVSVSRSHKVLQIVAGSLYSRVSRQVNWSWRSLTALHFFTDGSSFKKSHRPRGISTSSGRLARSPCAYKSDRDSSRPCLPLLFSAKPPSSPFRRVVTNYTIDAPIL